MMTECQLISLCIHKLIRVVVNEPPRFVRLFVDWLSVVLPSIKALPSSLFQLTRGAGLPLPRQSNETRTFSLTESCEGELSSSITDGGTKYKIKEQNPSFSDDFHLPWTSWKPFPTVTFSNDFWFGQTKAKKETMGNLIGNLFAWSTLSITSYVGEYSRTPPFRISETEQNHQPTLLRSHMHQHTPNPTALLIDIRVYFFITKGTISMNE